MPLRSVSQQLAIVLVTFGVALFGMGLVFEPALRHGWPLVGLGALCAVACCVVWLWLRHTLTRRLEELGRIAEQHLHGNRAERFPEQGHGELARIGRLLNSVVAELVKSNAELRRSEAKYRVIAEYSRDALTAVDATDGRFVSVNRTAVKLFGVADEAALLAMTPADVSPELQPDGTPSAEASRIHIQTAMRDGFADFEWTHRSVDGRLIPCSVQLARFELDGQVLVQGTVRDITDVRAAEERNQVLQARIQEAQKLEAIGRLAGGVAHDFNNMLAVISLQADLALALLDSGGAPREQLDQICRITERTAGLVQQLLAFSRRQSAAPRPLNLDAAVDSSLNLLRPGLGEGMQVTWRPGAGQWQVRLDPVQVDQILTNLCSNARDACKGQGRITIATREVQLDRLACVGLSGLAPGPHVELRVEDDGPGFSEEALAHIFEPFFTTKEVGRGTGLGLASVYGIVRQAGGDVRADSRPGRGARFMLYFPRYEGPVGEEIGPRADTAVAAPAERAPTQERILLVEDQPELLSLFEEALQRAGYSVLAVSDPAAALAAAGEPGFGFDLLLSDVVMPGMNGLRLAQELKAGHPGMRELFMSGYSADAMEERGLDTQGVHILAKPFHMSDLLRAVQSILQGKAL